MTGALSLGFAGTPAFAARLLERLIAAGYRPGIVYTQPDRPAGRGRRMLASPVKHLAEQRGLPVRQPASLRRERLPDGLDVLVVAAYGLLLPKHVLDAPRYGCINVHASLLPRWRGAAPVERSIIAGDSTTGVSIMRMDEGLDTGPVYRRAELAIPADATGGELERALAELGADALLGCLAALPSLVPIPQPGTGITYAHKLTPADSRIDWRSSAADLARRVRALSDRLPVVVHGATEGVPVRIRILHAIVVHDTARGPLPGTVIAASRDGIDLQCGTGVLRVQRVQLNRGKGTPLDAAQAISGYASLFAPGSILSSDPPEASAGGTG